ncbi:MAG TPA: hypothetical protein VIG62_22630 [Blastocatellia bacterium]|jgi:uncharacterized HAD superfamily protein
MAKKRKDVIVDIDGTLADVSHRLHHIRGKRKSWKKFFALMKEDKPVEEIVGQVRQLAKDHNIYVVSGRPDDYREETLEWLALHRVPFKALYMRKASDFRPDDVIKQEILEKHFKKENVELVIEDRPRVIRMWQRNGLRVQQVGTGEEF